MFFFKFFLINLNYVLKYIIIIIIILFYLFIIYAKKHKKITFLIFQNINFLKFFIFLILCDCFVLLSETSLWPSFFSLRCWFFFTSSEFSGVFNPKIFIRFHMIIKAAISKPASFSKETFFWLGFPLVWITY